MTHSVPSSDSGTEMAAASTADQRRRNTATTRITSATVISSVCSTSATLARIVSERSRNVCTRMPAGSQRSSSGSMAWMPSTTSMTLASGCLKMTMMMAGRPLKLPAWRRSRTPSSTLATWLSRMMAPFCARKIRFA